MTMLTSKTPQAFLPDEFGNLVVIPMTQQSVAFAAAGALPVKGRADAYRIPIVNTDPSADWVAEGAEIPVTEQGLGEVFDVFHKLSGLTIISREMRDDTNPGVQQTIGMGLARDLARKADVAIFGARGDNHLAPQGLEDLEGVTTIDAGDKWTNIDPFTEAIYAAANVGATLAAFVANPADAVALATLKRGSGSMEPLLGPDPTEPGRQQIQGIKLLTSPAVTPGTVWGIPGNNLVALPIREDANIEVDDSVYFTSDRTAIKATLRITALYPHEEAIQKITLSK